MNGSLPLPAGFTLSGSLQNVAGPNVLATWNAPNSQIADSLGRNLSACGTRTLATCTSTAQIPLIPAGTVYEDRRTQIDMRLGKTFKVGGKARLQTNLDVYNITNSAAILAINTNYGPQWRLPIPSSSGSAILDGRLMQLSGNFSF